MAEFPEMPDSLDAVRQTTSNMGAEPAQIPATLPANVPQWGTETEDVDLENAIELAPLAPSHQARIILHAGFTALPILAGLDKFTNFMCRWEDYLAPEIPRLLGVKPKTFMRAVGVIEIAAGLLTAVRPKLGSTVVAGWLGGIIGNLVLGRRAYDVALRDFGLAMGALALNRVAKVDR